MRSALTGIDGDVRLHSNGDHLVMTSGRRRFAVPVLPPQDFPGVDLEGRAEPVECDGPALAEALSAVQYAAGTSGSAGAVTEGVLLERGNVFATDGTRMALCEVTVDLAEHDRLVLPKPTIKPLCSLLSAEGRLSLVRDGAGVAASLVAENEHSRLVIRLIGMTYPDWRRVMKVHKDDKETVGEATLHDHGEMRNVLSRLRAFCGSKQPLLVFTSADGALAVRPKDSDAAEDTVEAAAQGELDVCMNADMLGDILGKAANDATIQWRCYGALGLQEWRIEGRADEHYMMAYRR